MSLWEAILLGMVQGATEFLPVSSSGHLVAGQALLGIRVPGVAFEVAVHVATLVSILIVYRDRVAQLVRGLVTGERTSWVYAGLLVAATIPAAVVGLLLKDAVETLFENPTFVGLAFLVTGALLWTTRAALARDPRREPGLGDAVVIGLAQAVAILPGISRSGSTVVAGLWLGVDPVRAAELSFLMAVPAILGAAVLQLPELAGETGIGMGGVLVAGSAVAAVTGVLAIRTFLRMLRKRSFHHFAVYLWIVGALFLGWLWIGR